MRTMSDVRREMRALRNSPVSFLFLPLTMTVSEHSSVNQRRFATPTGKRTSSKEAQGFHSGWVDGGHRVVIASCLVHYELVGRLLGPEDSGFDPFDFGSANVSLSQLVSFILERCFSVVLTML
jgi:hypothetical protein